jgi:hypothetical protein
MLKHQLLIGELDPDSLATVLVVDSHSLV